jgi:hypothetical protein
LISGKDRKLAELMKKLGKSDSRLEQAELNQKAAYEARLQSATMKESLKRLPLYAEQICDMLSERRKKLNTRNKVVNTKLDDAQITERKAANLLTQRKEEMDIVEANLKQKRNELLSDELDKSSDAYLVVKNEVRALEKNLEEKKGQVLQATEVNQAATAFVEKLQILSRTLTSQISILKSREASLRTKTKYRTEYYNGYLASVKAKNDQEAATMLDQLGTKQDERISVQLAEIYKASNEELLIAIKEAPNHIMKSRIYKAAIDKMEEENLKELRAEYEKFKNDYGYDPSMSLDDITSNNPRTNEVFGDDPKEVATESSDGEPDVFEGM